MSLRGTHSHATTTDPLPARVAAAVDLARSRDFPLSCRIEQGRLVHALAQGARVRIGETGTGLGVGLAWLLEARHPGVPVVSVDRDTERVAAVREMFAGVPDLTLLNDDWRAANNTAPSISWSLTAGATARRSLRSTPLRSSVPGARSSSTTSPPQTGGHRCTPGSVTTHGSGGSSIPACRPPRSGSPRTSPPSSPPVAADRSIQERTRGPRGGKSRGQTKPAGMRSSR